MNKAITQIITILATTATDFTTLAATTLCLYAIWSCTTIVLELIKQRPRK